MTLKEIQALLASFDASAATVLKMQDGSFSLELQKEGVLSQPLQGVSAPLSVPKEDRPVQASVEPSEEGVDIVAPLPGIFYSAPEEGAEPFVKVGDHVEKGQTIGLIEAMKIFNEVPAPCSGVIKKINVGNGDVIGFHDVLMWMSVDV